MQKNITSFFARLVPALGLTCLLAQAAQAQKIPDEQLWTACHKTPALALAPKYATYSVEYDLGNMVMNVNNRPSLAGLTYQKADGDVLLRITVKKLYITDRKLNESTSNNVYSAYYTLGYSVECGYELRDRKTDQVLTSYHKTGGSEYTQSFKNVRDLNGYVDNAWLGDKAQQLVTQMGQRVDFTLNPHDYRVGLTLNSIEGKFPAYAEINKATTDLKTMLAAKTPIDKNQLAALNAAWEKHLSNANWEDKKSEINKRVANALIANLCATALLAEEYDKLGKYTTDYAKHNSGAFSMISTAMSNNKPSFEVDKSYGGNGSALPYATLFKQSAEKGKGVYFSELVADLSPGE